MSAFTSITLPITTTPFADVERAGGKILERGEHAPGVPFARIADPDGNVFEI